MASELKSEYFARVTNDTGIVRAKVPSPLVRLMGGRPGDYLVFRVDGAKRVTMGVSRSKGRTKRSSAKGATKSVRKRN